MQAPDNTTPAAPLTPQSERNEKLNRILQATDTLIQGATPDPLAQLSILTMACALALRRIMANNRSTSRGARMKLIRAAVTDFENKARKYGTPSDDPKTII